MARTCSICRHEELEAINRALLSPAATFRDIAERYEAGTSSLHRHVQHLPQQLVKAHEAEQIASADRLLAGVDSLRTQAEEILAEAKGERDWRGATAAIREARGCVESMFKLAAVIHEKRYGREHIEWWGRQLMRAFREQLSSVAQGHRTEDDAMQAIVDEVERLLAAGPEEEPVRS